MNATKKLTRPLAIILAIAMSASACSSGGDDGAGEPTDREALVLTQPDPDETPIEADPNVRIGTLENGLTYYVHSNPTPDDGVSLRLVVNAGSMQQEDADSGSAHFLEHMLFNGTEKYPGNELTKTLERLGVEFGADSNAYTGADETVYEMDIPNSSDAKLDVGLDVLAQWASAATISEEDTINERGVVREEARLFLEGPGAEYQDNVIEGLTAGTDYENRLPIGTVDKISETTSEQLREFYDRWYRPNLMAIIAVGDAPADELEAKISERFSSLESRGDNEERTDPSVTRSQQNRVASVLDPSMSTTTATLTFPVNVYDFGTVGGERLTIIQRLYGLMIMNRLIDDNEQGKVDLVQPFAGVGPIFREQMALNVVYESDDLAAATSHVMAQLRNIEVNGFSDAEQEQAIAELQNFLDQDLAAASTKESTLLSNEYVQHFLNGSEIASAEADHERVSTVLNSVTPQEILDLFRWDYATASLQLVAGGPNADTLPTEDELDAALEAANDLEIAPPADINTIDQLMAPPALIEPTSTTSLDGFDGKEMVFENGLTVRYLATKTEAGRVEIAGMRDGGLGVLDPEDAAVSAEAIAAVENSGVGEFERSDYRRFLDRTTTSLMGVQTDTFDGFFGNAGSDDLEILLQRFHLGVTSPRVDDAALKEILTFAESNRTDFDVNAEAATANEVARILYKDDDRLDLKPSDSVEDLTAERALEIYKARFNGVDGMTIGIVGDFDEEQVEKLAAQYLGTLPAGDSAETVNIRPEIISELERRELAIDGADEAAGAVAVTYQVAMPITTEVQIQLQVLNGILNDRLFATAREDLGATYGGSVFSYGEEAPIDTATVSFSSTGDPDRTEEILDVMVDAAETLAADGPAADEFDRAKIVIAADYEADAPNEQLSFILTEADLVTPEDRREVLAGVTPDDVQQLAKKMFEQGVRAEALSVR